MNKIYSFFALLLIGNLGYSQIISQYIETNSGSDPKGIEIWNNTGATLDFSVNNLVIEKGTNGGAPSTDFTINSGTLLAGEVIVIGTSDMQTVTLANGSVFFLKAFTFNGDDSLVVRFGGTITDTFGTAGSDPGNSWDGSGVSTRNQNIEINGGITTGDLDGWTDPSTRYSTVNTDPNGVNGDAGFGIAPAGAPSNDSDSESYDTGAQPASTTISSLADTAGEAVNVMEMTLEDLASGDGLDTDVTNIRLKPHTTNTADWTDHIQSVTLDNGASITINSVTIDDTFIDIAITSGDLVISDGTTDDITVAVYLNTSNLTDNAVLSFFVDSDDNGFTADAAGSAFNSTFILGDFNSNDFTIDVDATLIAFSQQPPAIVDINSAMANVIVQAQDANGNLDTDYNLDIDMTSSGTLSVSPITETSVSGTATFSTITHTAVGTALVLTADDSVFSTVNSTTFDVAVLPTTIAQQDFDGGLPNWTYANDVTLFDNTWGGDGYYGLIDISLAAPINLVSMSANILGENDLDDEGANGTTGFATTTFGTVDVSLYEDVDLTFDWQVVAYNALSDDARYQVFFDGVGQGIVYLVDGGGGNPADGSGTVTIDVPNAITTVSLEIQVRNNGLSGYSGFDNFGITGFLPSVVYEGNDSNGFGGPLGLGDLEVAAFTGTSADFTLIKGAGDFNDHIVLYIDSEAGGITTTSGLTDTADAGRRAVSGYDGTNRSTINFPPGFGADFAIALDNGFAGLFQIVEGGSHVFVANLGLTPTGATQPTYDFSADFADMNTTAGASSFKFFATYLNSTNAFRSNEFIGRSIYDSNATANPGYTTVDMQTYYQASSRKQGGEAPSTASGLWSNDASWTNGNAPLVGDEITINNDVTQDVNFNTNSLSIAGANTLTVNAGQSLQMSGGISGTGNLSVSGELSFTEGGFTDLEPVYASGATLEYINITGTYVRFNEWSNGTSLGAGVPDNVIIDNVALDLTNGSQPVSVDFSIGSDISILNSGSLTIDSNESLTLGGNVNITGADLYLNSIATEYSSLIVGGTSSGDVTYRRHINTLSGTGTTTGNNDLVSAPVTNASQIFSVFRTNNANIPSGNISGTLSYLFGPFDNVTNAYTNFTAANDSDILTAGTGYRTASTDTSTFTFIGDVETGTVTANIAIGAGSEWNLIGNPYPSYINSGDFLTENAAFLDENAIGIYGYDGSADNGWTIINFNNANTAANIAPGQGFMVAAEGTSTLNFTPAMRNISGTDDFIVGRVENNEYLRLQIENGDSNYHTDFYFNDNSTQALDPGYDAALFNSFLPEFYVYSHLVSNNTGRSMAIQSLSSTDLSNVTIPLGVNADMGEQITFSIVESSLPNTIDVYLDDTIANTSTLLTNADYVFTPNVNLSGTGRFFLRYTEDALSTSENSLNNLDIYASKEAKEIVINGQLLENTVLNLYDIQGRLVMTSKLDNSLLENRIDVANVTSGIYIVSLENNTQKKSQKVIIE